MTEKGFVVSEICEVENNSEEIEKKLSEYAGEENNVIILSSDRYWRKNSGCFKQYPGSCQLFSSMNIFYNVMKPSLKEVYNLLEDDLSKEIFTEVLNVRFKIKSVKALYPYFDNNQYFTLPDMNMFDADAVFVDCGAFVGDTVERFINNCQSIFGKIYAFEPSKIQAEAFTERRKRLMKEWALDETKINLINAGAGSKNTEGFMVRGQLEDHIIGRRISFDKNAENISDDKVKIVSLDEFFGNGRVDFIKSDIEGSEMEMLRGAKNIILTQKPRLALSIYHKLTDYYEMPLYIKSLVPEYKMKIRHHSTDFTETVLYCYI